MTKISIYDNDLNNYLVENQTTKTAYSEYLHFRNEEFLGEWWNGNKEIAPIFDKIYYAITDDEFNSMYDSLFNLWVDEVVTTQKGIAFIKEDISACNFTIETI